MSFVANGVEFASFGDECPSMWLRIEGALLRHALLGIGTITAVKPRQGLSPLVTISFDGKTEIFNSDSFKKGRVTEIELPHDIEERFLAWRSNWIKEQEQVSAEATLKTQRERDSQVTKQTLLALAKKYNVRIAHLLAPSSCALLSRIFSKLEHGNAFVWEETLDEDDIAVIEEKFDLNISASFHLCHFNNTRDLWSLVKASSALRHAGMSERALIITDGFPRPECESIVAAALLTTRGGAFRDLDQVSDAKTCAMHALDRCATSFHPYNLLGAIAYGEQNFIHGDEHFQRAVQLGSHAKEQEREIRKALRRGDPASRTALIDYLLKKDFKKYAWVVLYKFIGSL